MASNDGPVRRVRWLFDQLTDERILCAVLSVVYFFVIAAIVPSMLSPHNLSNIFSNMWPLFTIAVRAAFVLLLGGIDLSQDLVMASPASSAPRHVLRRQPGGPEQLAAVGQVPD